ncbi:hypothetical protein L218DRAFT_950210 [Marasmius fiardii PR-910]|nr:hypothetical protein L218DRAFT_950210 [Marasmius fiardii PR-910]
MGNLALQLTAAFFLSCPYKTNGQGQNSTLAFFLTLNLDSANASVSSKDPIVNAFKLQLQKADLYQGSNGLYLLPKAQNSSEDTPYLSGHLKSPLVPGGDEVFLHDPYPTNFAFTSSPTPATNHSDFQLSQSESRHSHSTARESFSQSPSVGHLDDSVTGVWGHSSTNKPSKTEFDKRQSSSGYGHTGYPDFPQGRGNNIPNINTEYNSSDTTDGQNRFSRNSTDLTGNRIPIQNPSPTIPPQEKLSEELGQKQKKLCALVPTAAVFAATIVELIQYLWTIQSKWTRM